jgi:CubicO group peptidase (beta-lactamase class C family)
LSKTQTTSFIVIKDDKVVYERYFNGFDRQSVVTSFSMAKSFASTLVGIAIDKGMINSVDDPITTYLPELEHRDARFGQISIADLLHMASGIAYDEDGPMRDDQRTYMDPNLRRAALEHTRIAEAPNRHWLYNNYNPLLVGMILERATHMSVTGFMQANLWDPLGMEFGGSWSIDSKDGAFEKMESGINARAIDFAKLGLLFLHHGSARGRPIVSAAWVKKATQPHGDPREFYGDASDSFYYGYYWWGSRRDQGDSDFYAEGNKGQFMYCSPQRHLVIVRTGIQYGIPAYAWSRIFRQVADSY